MTVNDILDDKFNLNHRTSVIILNFSNVAGVLHQEPSQYKVILV
jgi:hypothetical protein